MKNKLIKYFVATVITVVVVCLSVDIYMRNKAKANKADIAREVAYSNNIQVYAAIYDNILLDKKSNIVIDDAFKNKIKSDVKEIAKYYNNKWNDSLYDDFQFYDLCKKMGITQDKITLKYIMSYYDKKDGYFYSSEYEIKHKDKHTKEQYIDNTLSIAYYLYEYVDRNEYDIVEKCAEWYNEYIKTADITNEDDISFGIAIKSLGFLERTDNLNKINIVETKQYLLEGFSPEDIDQTYNNNNISNVVDLVYYNYYMENLGEKKSDIDIDRIYKGLNNEEEFEISSEGCDFFGLLFMNDSLAFVDDLSVNKYYVDNINRWLQEVYDNDIEDLED